MVVSKSNGVVPFLKKNLTAIKVYSQFWQYFCLHYFQAYWLNTRTGVGIKRKRTSSSVPDNSKQMKLEKTDSAEVSNSPNQTAILPFPSVPNPTPTTALFSTPNTLQIQMKVCHVFLFRSQILVLRCRTSSQQKYLMTR